MPSSLINRIDNRTLSQIFEALKYAAYKHRRQKRKGAIGIPYINHPIDVANMLVNTIEKPSDELIIAALLHDIIEDTRTKFSDLEKQFGTTVTNIVREVTDDMTLPSIVRKRDQITKAKSLSYSAKCIKIADKTCNIHDLLFTRIKWPRRRKIEYIIWANDMVSQILDVNEGLARQFDEILKKAGNILDYPFSSD